jgi:hypothetical protein
MLSALTALSGRGRHIGLTKQQELLSRFADRRRAWSSLQQGTYRPRIAESIMSMANLSGGDLTSGAV